MNRGVENNLLAIITGLGTPSGCASSCSSSCACTPEASQPGKADTDAS